MVRNQNTVTCSDTTGSLTHHLNIHSSVSNQTAIKKQLNQTADAQPPSELFIDQEIQDFTWVVCIYNSEDGLYSGAVPI